MINDVHRLRVLDESLRQAHLPFVLRNPGILENLLASCSRISLPRILASIRSVRGEEVETEMETFH